MSVEYLAMANKAGNADCPNPTKPEAAPSGRRAVEEDDEPRQQQTQPRRLSRKR